MIGKKNGFGCIHRKRNITRGRTNGRFPCSRNSNVVFKNSTIPCRKGVTIWCFRQSPASRRQFTRKKSLSSWIHKVAKRAGVKLWKKPFQNCRSSRDTELRKKHPAHLVNEWIGHTQEVTEDHYIQELPDDFIDAYNAEKTGAKTVQELAGIGCFGAERLLPATTERISFHATMARFCKEFFRKSEETENAPTRLGRT